MFGESQPFCGVPMTLKINFCGCKTYKKKSACMSRSVETAEKHRVHASRLLLRVLCCAGVQPRLLSVIMICIHLAGLAASRGAFWSHCTPLQSARINTGFPGIPFLFRVGSLLHPIFRTLSGSSLISRALLPFPHSVTVRSKAQSQSL